MIQVTKVKKVFHDAGIQLSADVIDIIKDDKKVMKLIGLVGKKKFRVFLFKNLL